jgi:hypothetical protein
MSAEEQIAGTVMERIKAAPTIEGKVRELIDGIDCMWSIPPDCEGAQLTRLRRILALAAVGEFFVAMGRRDIGAEFKELGFVLQQQTRKEIRRSGGGPTPRDSAVSRGRAYVAVAAEILHGLKMKLKEVEGYIHQWRNKLSPLLDEKQSPAKFGAIAMKWRERFNAGKETNHPEAVDVYKHWTAHAAERAEHPDALKKLADVLLEEAANFARQVAQDSRQLG